ncbi:MAG TPA: hypothetical protein VFK39_03840 [Gemmatimonadaceae bacterium]|nr:hypothetical protein [Gemmatimonadaceae bacterium]
MQFEGEPHIIVGITAASLTIPEFKAERADILVPLVLMPRSTYAGGVLVRLKPGRSRDVATAELAAITKRSRIVTERPIPPPMQLRLTRPQDRLQIREALIMLTGAWHSCSSLRARTSHTSFWLVARHGSESSPFVTLWARRDCASSASS